eukprot:11369540-Karenia_brevis.AAC.1
MVARTDLLLSFMIDNDLRVVSSEIELGNTRHDWDQLHTLDTHGSKLDHVLCSPGMLCDYMSVDMELYGAV